MYVLGNKVSIKLDFSKGWPEKTVQKRGNDIDERTQEDYTTFAKIQSGCRVVFLHSLTATRRMTHICDTQLLVVGMVVTNT